MAPGHTATHHAPPHSEEGAVVLPRRTQGRVRLTVAKAQGAATAGTFKLLDYFPALAWVDVLSRLSLVKATALAREEPPIPTEEEEPRQSASLWLHAEEIDGALRHQAAWAQTSWSPGGAGCGQRRWSL